MADKKNAQWLEKDNERHLFHGDDVEDAQKNGYSVVDGERPNGEPYNPTDEDAIAALNAAAESQKASNEAKAKKDEKKAEEAEKARKANEEAAKKAPVEPDLKVQVVEAPKKK